MLSVRIRCTRRREPSFKGETIAGKGTLAIALPKEPAARNWLAIGAGLRLRRMSIADRRPRKRRGATLELVEAAARLLAVGDGTIKARLLAAYTDQLQYVVQAEVPAELVPRLVSIRQRLDAAGARSSQSSVQSAIDRMTDAEAVKIAADIFDFNVALSCALYH